MTNGSDASKDELQRARIETIASREQIKLEEEGTNHLLLAAIGPALSLQTRSPVQRRVGLENP